ncbi:MAG: DNA-binding domain-containing protein [Caulobacteraceae bacterium]
MSGLLDLQRGLRDHILSRTPEDSGQSIAPQFGGAPAAGLAVYHNAYRAQLVACLRDTFEKTWAWLGDDAFDAAARAHIEAHPPHSWTLGDYGVDFGETLAGLYPDDPEVAELAWLDWTLRRAFEGPDAEPISQDALAEVDWDNAVLVLLPTLRIGEVATNCALLWGAIAEEQTPPPAERLPHPGAVRVWRQGLSPQYRTIEADERRALEMVEAAAPFGEICAMLSEGLDDAQAAQRIGALLASWLQDGLVIGAA